MKSVNTELIYMLDLAYLRQDWVGRVVVAYSREVFGEHGRHVMIRDLLNEWVVVETMKEDRVKGVMVWLPSGDTYLIPSSHIYFKRTRR